MAKVTPKENFLMLLNGGTPAYIPYYAMMGDGHRGAHGQSDDDHRQHVHHLAAHRHRGDGSRTVKLSRDEQVCKSVERLQEARDEKRPCKPEQIPHDASPGHVLLHVIPPDKDPAMAADNTGSGVRFLFAPHKKAAKLWPGTCPIQSSAAGCRGTSPADSAEFLTKQSISDPAEKYIRHFLEPLGRSAAFCKIPPKNVPQV